jgi:hypothetical protein
MGMTKEAWAVIPKSERRRRALKARRTAALKLVTEHMDEFTEEEKDQIQDALFPSGDAA